MRMSEYMEELTTEFKDEIIKMLGYEMKIKLKKINKEPLTEEEYIFDKYMVKPSTIIKDIIERRSNNDE